MGKFPWLYFWCCKVESCLKIAKHCFWTHGSTGKLNRSIFRAVSCIDTAPFHLDTFCICGLTPLRNTHSYILFVMCFLEVKHITCYFYLHRFVQCTQMFYQLHFSSFSSFFSWIKGVNARYKCMLKIGQNDTFGAWDFFLKKNGHFGKKITIPKGRNLCKRSSYLLVSYKKEAVVGTNCLLPKSGAIGSQTARAARDAHFPFHICLFKNACIMHKFDCWKI